jgi:hypothetical protein
VRLDQITPRVLEQVVQQLLFPCQLEGRGEMRPEERLGGCAIGEVCEVGELDEEREGE